MTVQRMQRGRQKTMSRGGGQTGGKNTRRAPNPGLSCPLLRIFIYVCAREATVCVSASRCSLSNGGQTARTPR